MTANGRNHATGLEPLSIPQALAAVFPFLAFGLASLVSQLNLVDHRPTVPPFWQTLLISPYLVFNWIILVGLGVGVYKGFPRWTISYLLWALYFGWWWTNMSFFGYHWSGQIWLSFGAAILLPLLLKTILAAAQDAWRQVLAGLDLTLPRVIYLLLRPLPDR